MTFQSDALFDLQAMQHKHKREKEEMRMFVEERASVLNNKDREVRPAPILRRASRVR